MTACSSRRAPVGDSPAGQRAWVACRCTRCVEALVAAIRPNLFAAIRRRPNRLTIEDAHQVLLTDALYRAMRTWPGRGVFAAWFSVVARTALIDAARAEHRVRPAAHLSLDFVDDDGRSLEHLARDMVDPLQTLLWREQIAEAPLALRLATGAHLITHRPQESL